MSDRSDRPDRPNRSDRRPPEPGPLGSRGDEAERLLAAAFAERPVPELSARFDARLRQRLEAERLRAARRRRRWRWVLAAYWLAALVAIGALVEATGLVPSLPDAAWPPLLAMLVLTLAGVAFPLAALADRWSRTPGLPRRVILPPGL